jgi:hypothetical protein
MSAQRTLPLVAWTSTIVLACVAFDVALHDLCESAFHFNYFDNGLPQSVVVTSGFFNIAASAGFALIFGFLAWMFLGARQDLGGSALRAGQRFFAPIAVVMFFGVLESAFVFPTPFRPELITAIADAVPFVLLGALLSRVARSPTHGESSTGGRSASWRSMLWVALFFVGGRYLVSYPMLRIVSGYFARPVGTLLWTIGCGLGMGAFYWLAGSAFSSATPLRRAIRVGLTLGVFWLMVQLFLAMISAVSILDLAIRGSADTAYLVAGIYGFERLFRRRESRSAPGFGTELPRGA